MIASLLLPHPGQGITSATHETLTGTLVSGVSTSKVNDFETDPDVFPMEDVQNIVNKIFENYIR